MWIFHINYPKAILVISLIFKIFYNSLDVIWYYFTHFQRLFKIHYTSQTYNTIIFSTSSILNSQNSNIWILKTQLYINYPKTFSQNFTNIWNIYNNLSSYIIFKRFLKFIIYFIILFSKLFQNSFMTFLISLYPQYLQFQIYKVHEYNTITLIIKMLFSKSTDI